MRVFLTAIIVVFLAGCGVLTPQTSKKTSTATDSTASTLKSAENFRSVVTGTKPPVQQTTTELKIGGVGNKVELKMPELKPVVDPTNVAPYVAPVSPRQTAFASPPLAPVEPYREEISYNVNSDSKDKGTSASSFMKESTIPLGVNLALLGIGILIVMYAIKYARASSLSANAAYTAVDSALAEQIRAFRAKAITATDPQTITLLQSQIAEMESQRGKLAK